MHFASRRYKNVNETMLYCLEVTFSKVILIFVLHIHKQVCEKSDVPYSNTRYIMYGIILLYSLINMSVIVENFKMEKKIICVQSTWDVLFWQIYTFYIL